MSIRKYIPNTITSLNLLSGCFATIYAMGGNFKFAFYCIILSAIFDFLDGFAARLLKAYSPMGKELDSLADMVSFGLAPAMMMFTCSKIIVETKLGILHEASFMQQGGRNILIFAPLTIAVFSGLRLAKFNIDTRQSENFIGLATPSCALICGSLLYAMEIYPTIAVFLFNYPYTIPMISIFLSYLLISEFPMFSFKFKSLSIKDNLQRFVFIAIIACLGIICLILGLNWSLWVLSIFLIYIIMNFILLFARQK